MIKFLFRYKIVRIFAGGGILCKAYINFLFGSFFQGICDICWVYRVSNISWLKKIAFYQISKIVRACMLEGINPILMSYYTTDLPRKARARYSIDGPGELELFRDVMVLKLPQGKEKGVIVIKYGETYDAFLAYFNFDNVLAKYYIVLEMSWSGACDPSILMFVTPGKPVLVQTPEQDDYNFITELRSNLIPVSLGSGDWVDSEHFTPEENVLKKYDVVMVANWAKHKNHKKLFQALKKLRKRKLKIALIGFPWGGRTKKDIQKEIESMCLKNTPIEFDFFENLTHTEVLMIIQRSKCSLLLSEKEGGNKAIVESIFLDVPIIVYDKHKGGSLEKVNQFTGIASSFSDLAQNIEFMVDHYTKFSPRNWALANTGAENATKILNEKLRQVALESGEPWTSNIVVKVNAPNLQYKNEADKSRLAEGYSFLLANKRPV